MATVTTMMRRAPNLSEMMVTITLKNDDNDDDEDNDLDECKYASKYVDSGTWGIPIIEVKHTEETKKVKAE